MSEKRRLYAVINQEGQWLGFENGPAVYAPDAGELWVSRKDAEFFAERNCGVVIPLVCERDLLDAESAPAEAGKLATEESWDNAPR